MYIVIPQPAVNQINFSNAFNTEVPKYFQTKELLLNYLKTSPGNVRVFEATELDFNVDVTLQPKLNVDTTSISTIGALSR